MGASGAGISWSGKPLLLGGGIISLLIVAGGLIFLFVLLRRRKREIERAITSRYPEDAILFRDDGASLFGMASLGRGQVRGNGTLILTEDELVFMMLVPRREIRIPLSSIIRIETPKSFLGKTRFTPLLKIDFSTPTGKTDSAAWAIRDIESCLNLLEKRKGYQQR